jgi:hypothetical protein
MIDFKTVTVEINGYLQTNLERTIGGVSDDPIPFAQAGTLIGQSVVNFDSNVNKFEVAIQSFHFETKNDHNIAKLKLEPQIINRSSVPSRSLEVRVLASFRDNSPEDDFEQDKYIMTATLLVIVDRD